ncbi:MAG: hypothetical protein PVJ39_20345 [Gammaproteobacteria bacterium]|jgi:hypothetical protein
MGKRHDTDKAIRNLLKWSERPEWLDRKMSVLEEHLGPVGDQLDITPDELFQELGEAGCWDMIHGMILEDFFSCRFDPDDSNVIDDYLRSRGWRESYRGRCYLERLRDSVPSLYELVDVSPGKHCDVKDLVRNGKPVRVYEKMGTQNLVKWDRLATRVIKLDGKHYFTGGILPLKHDVSTLLIEQLEQLQLELKTNAKKQKTQDPSLPDIKTKSQLLRSFCPFITLAWIADAFNALHQSLPELSNSSGDRLSFTETFFPYQDQNRDLIIQRLNESVEWVCDDEQESRWVWLFDGKSDTKAQDSSGLYIETFRDGESTIYGSLVVNPKQLSFTANSMERAEQGKELLRATLDGLIGEPLTKIETPEQIMEKLDVQASGVNEQSEPSDIDPEIEKEIIKKTMDTHYLKCLDDKIPVLNDKTPRECAKTKSGRKKVIEWLKYLENQELKRANKAHIEPYDFTWMWRELGLEREEASCT